MGIQRIIRVIKALGEKLRRSNLLNAIEGLRLLSALAVFMGSMTGFSHYFPAYLRSFIPPTTNVIVIFVLVATGVVVGFFLSAFAGILIFNGFSFLLSRKLPQAMRLNEAMRLLHAKTNAESLTALKFYRIEVFKTATPLGDSIEHDIKCRPLTTFLAPWNSKAKHDAALGSAHYGCDYLQIQNIIAENQNKWGTPGSDKDDRAELQEKLARLKEEKKKVAQELSAATGREAILKRQLQESKAHMAVLVKLAHQATMTVKPPQSLTREAIKRRYADLAAQHGLDATPGDYVEIFRSAMPKEYINQGGAPSQASPPPET